MAYYRDILTKLSKADKKSIEIKDSEKISLPSLILPKIEDGEETK